MQNIKLAAGLALVLAPFVGLTILMFRDGGWRTALAVWGIVALIGGSIGGGIAILATL